MLDDEGGVTRRPLNPAQAWTIAASAFGLLGRDVRGPDKHAPLLSLTDWRRA